MIIFTAASYLCGQSDSLLELIIWRFVQGIGGGALLSTSQAILFDAFEPVEMFFKTHKYNIGLLSDKDNVEMKFYQNDLFFGGNSYYKEYNNESYKNKCC